MVSRFAVCSGLLPEHQPQTQLVQGTLQTSRVQLNVRRLPQPVMIWRQAPLLYYKIGLHLSRSASRTVTPRSAAAANFSARTSVPAAAPLAQAK